ncbi:MAG TPA: MFS transporter [Prolixibacteraceae bacterium]|nr:MFS transporter [Prolixibacteraceae bacterium]
MLKKGIANNIFKLYVIKTAKWFSLIMPIVVLFYQDNGLSMTQIFLLKSVYSVGMLALEIPSGYFGDVWGRKKTLITGAILSTLGFSLYSFSFAFWQFMIAELILGIGQSFISGSDSAMLYDTLKSQKREKSYLKYEGRVTSVGNFSEAIAGILGGLLATISLRTPFFFQVGISAAAIPAALTLIEPQYSLHNRVAGMKDILKVVKYSLVDFKQLRYFIFFSSLIGAATLTYAWFIQPYLIAIDFPLPLFGVIWTLLNLTVGTSSIFAYKIEHRFSQKQTTGFIYIAISLGFIVTAAFVSLWAIPLLFVFYIVRGIATPVLKDYINMLIGSEVRATVLSLRNMFIRIIFAIIGPLLGWFSDHYSIKTGLMVAGIFFLTSGTVLFYLSYFSKSITKPS